MKHGSTIAVSCAAALILGVGGGPLTAAAGEPPTRSDGPQVRANSDEARSALRNAVKGARELYRAEVRVALAQYELALAPARNKLSADLLTAKSTTARRDAERLYTEAKRAARNTLDSARAAAAAKRDATIDKALAEYLLATGKADVVEALAAYKLATEMAGNTLKLALDSARAAFRTDTSDERADLMEALAEATTGAERGQANADYERGIADERAAYERSIAGARATYASAMRKARAAFRATTGTTPKKLAELPFQV